MFVTFSSFFRIQVIPKPILTLLDFSFPLASSDLGADKLENEFILNNLHLSQVYLFFCIFFFFGGGGGVFGLITINRSAGIVLYLLAALL